MKNTIALILLASLIVVAVANGQGLQLNKPTEFGLGLVGMHQDKIGKTSNIGPGFEAFIRYKVSPQFLLSIGTGYLTATAKSFTINVADLGIPGASGDVKIDKYTFTMLPSLEIKGIFQPKNPGKTIPFAFVGAQAFGWKNKIEVGSNTMTSDKMYYDANLLAGAGLQTALNEKTSFHLMGDYRLMVSQEGSPKPKFWSLHAGLTFAIQPSSGGSARPSGEEIEYPADDQGVADLGDLFKEDNTPSGGNASTTPGGEEDALSLLFSQSDQEQGNASETGGTDSELSSLFGEEESGSEVTDTNTGTDAGYPDTEVGRLMKTVDEMKSELSSKSQQIEQLQSKLDIMESGQGRGFSGKSLSESEFQDNYAQALDKFHAHQFQDCISAFQSLAASNPGHMLASNCHYWMGESYNAVGNYRKALAEFAVVMTYKRSYKFDDALLMSGLCYMRLGETGNARTQFQELVSRYPDSEYAPKAMRFLGNL
jgi:tol-pal system protein YbgF